MTPVVEELAETYRDRVSVRRVHADEAPEEARALGVRALPTVIATHEGREVARVVGRQSRARLGRIFERAATGVAGPPLGPTALDRVLRSAAGIGLLLVAATARSPVLLGAALAALVAAFYDLVFVTRPRPRR